jgi:hypothetical protein
MPIAQYSFYNLGNVNANAPNLDLWQKSPFFATWNYQTEIFRTIHAISKINIYDLIELWAQPYLTYLEKILPLLYILP